MPIGDKDHMKKRQASWSTRPQKDGSSSIHALNLKKEKMSTPNFPSTISEAKHISTREECLAKRREASRHRRQMMRDHIEDMQRQVITISLKNADLRRQNQELEMSLKKARASASLIENGKRLQMRQLVSSYASNPTNGSTQPCNASVLNDLPFDRSRSFNPNSVPTVESQLRLQAMQSLQNKCLLFCRENSNAALELLRSRAMTSSIFHPLVASGSFPREEQGHLQGSTTLESLLRSQQAQVPFARNAVLVTNTQEVKSSYGRNTNQLLVNFLRSNSQTKRSDGVYSA
eukprot:scaffold1213_cov208-Alexandrium_tamarense.AAC.17